MKFTLDWLRTHLHTDAGLDAITNKLTAIGLELEGVEDPGAALAPFRIARVTEAVQHPNADRLRACTVDAGDGPVSVVCGAPNARAGMLAVFAPPGSFIPGTGITLKVGEIRGVQSAGMLLSRREMGLGEDHDGILELPEGAPVGTPYAAWMNGLWFTASWKDMGKGVQGKSIFLYMFSGEELYGRIASLQTTQ